MAMRFTKLPTDAFKHLQMNAGILVSSFTPSTGVVGDLIGASTGGIKFDANTTYVDRGADIDNCPKNCKELKDIDDVEAKLSGTFVTVTTATAKKLIASADVDTTDTSKVVPRRNIVSADFSDVWWIGDYSDKHGATNGGYVAVHLLNALSTGGFHIQSKNKDKGTFSFEFTAHYSLSEPDTVPYEVYVLLGTDEPAPGPSPDPEGT